MRRAQGYSAVEPRGARRGVRYCCILRCCICHLKTQLRGAWAVQPQSFHTWFPRTFHFRTHRSGERGTHARRSRRPGPLRTPTNTFCSLLTPYLILTYSARPPTRRSRCAIQTRLAHSTDDSALWTFVFSEDSFSLRWRCSGLSCECDSAHAGRGQSELGPVRLRVTHTGDWECTSHEPEAEPRSPHRTALLGKGKSGNVHMGNVLVRSDWADFW